MTLHVLHCCPLLVSHGMKQRATIGRQKIILLTDIERVTQMQVYVRVACLR